MIFKIFFFLIIVALSSNSNAQWLVDGGNLLWPHGNVSITKGIFKAYTTYNALVQDNGLHFFGNYETSPLFSTTRYGGTVKIFEQLDEPISSYMVPLSVYGIYKQQSDTNNLSAYVGSPRGFQLRLDTHLDNKDQLSGFASGIGLEIFHNGNYDLGISHGIHITQQILDTGDVKTHYGIYLDVPWGTSTGRYQDYYAYYSKLHNSTYIQGKKYHFYGEGDAPSYFGGATIQKVYTNDVDNPPTFGDLEGIFGTPEVAGAGFTASINDANESTNFYQVVSDGQMWWVFTASQAP